MQNVSWEYYTGDRVEITISLEHEIWSIVPVIVDGKVVNFTTFWLTIIGTIDAITSSKLISTLPKFHENWSIILAVISRVWTYIFVYLRIFFVGKAYH